MSGFSERSVTRRGFLGRACRWGAGLFALPWLASCAREEPFPGLSVEFSGVPEGRSVHLHENLPIELRREGDRITARSLLCTHQGCKVSWRPAEGGYHCPCHDGLFDASGHPVAGPPRERLRTYPVSREGDLVLVDTRAPAEPS